MKNLILTILLLSSLLANAQTPFWSKIKLDSGDSLKMIIIDWRDIGSVIITNPNTTKVIQLSAGQTFFPNAICLDGYDQTKAHNVEIKITAVASVTETVDNTSATFTSPGALWYNGNMAGWYNGTGAFSNVTNAFFTYTFTGRKIEVYGEKKNTHGIVAFSIYKPPLASGTETNVDLYSASTEFPALIYSSPVMPLGTYTIKMRITGTKYTASSDRYGLVDKFIVTK